MVAWILGWWRRWRTRQPEHLLRGQRGEAAARRELQRRGMRCLGANVRCHGGGEIDLVMRDHDTLVFVEVKARAKETWSRPAAAVGAKQRKRLAKAAMAYLREIHHPPCALRFDIVEVLLDAEGQVRELRHLPDAFPLSRPLRYD